ncbi:MAG: dicarboxylate/amino acid:cation symporter [Pseudomonadota bacterium]
MNPLKRWFEISLSKRIILMLVLGVITGLVLGADAIILKPIGDLFIRLLKMLIVPLVLFTVTAGVTKMDSANSLKKIGGFIFSYYGITSFMAATIGTIVALIFRPGLGVQGILGDAGKINVAKYSVVESLLNWVPTNPVEAMVSMNMLQIIFFSIILGLALLILGKKASLITQFVNQGADVVIRLTEMVMEVAAPFGIFALVAILAGTLGEKMMFAVAKFIVADFLAILAMILFVYPVLIKLVGRLSVKQVYKNMAPAMVVAATTTSSAATLPVSMKIAEKMGISERIFGFTLPIGCTMNMDGFAAALGVISVFALDIFQKPLNVSTIFMIIYLGLILSIGAAGVKGAGIVMSAVLFEALGLPLTLIPILAAVWPIIDIAHTTCNVTGDITGTVICASRFGEINEDLIHGPVQRASVT